MDAVLSWSLALFRTGSRDGNWQKVFLFIKALRSGTSSNRPHSYRHCSLGTLCDSQELLPRKWKQHFGNSSFQIFQSAGRSGKLLRIANFNVSLWNNSVKQTLNNESQKDSPACPRFPSLPVTFQAAHWNKMH